MLINTLKNAIIYGVVKQVERRNIMGKQLMRLHEMKLEVKKVEISSNGHGKEITVCYGKDVDWKEVLEECVKAFKLMDSDCLKKNDEIRFKIDDNHDAIVGKDWIVIQSDKRVWGMQTTYSEIDEIMREFSDMLERMDANPHITD